MVLSDQDGFCPKLIVTGCAFIECLLFGGLLVGWGSLTFMFKTEGLFACPTNTSSNVSNGASFDDGLNSNETKNLECIYQETMLTLCFTIGSTLCYSVGPAIVCIVSAILRQINYKCNTRITRIICFIVFVIGSLSMAFTSKETPWLMFPGLACLGIGGLPLLVTNTQVSNMLVKGSSTVVGLLCGAFDSSSAVMLMVKIASENGFSRQNMFFTITVLHLLVLVSTFFFLPKDFIKKRGIRIEGTENIVLDADSPICKQNKGKVDVTETYQPTLMSCLRNPMYLSHVLWLSLLQLRFFCFIGTLNHHLNVALSWDQVQVSHFTNVCFYTMMGGLVTSFLAGFVYDWQKSVLKDKKSERFRKVAPAAVPQGIATLLAVILSILVLIPNPQVLYLTFIVLTVFRSFLYSLSAGFIGEVFPSEYFGMLYCLMVIFGGIFGFLQYALFIWAEAYNGAEVHVQIFQLIMVCLTFAHPAYLFISSWKEESNIKNS